MDLLGCLGSEPWQTAILPFTGEGGEDGTVAKRRNGVMAISGVIVCGRIFHRNGYIHARLIPSESAKLLKFAFQYS